MPTPHRPWLQELIQEAKRNPSPPVPPVVLEFSYAQWSAMDQGLQEWLRCVSLRDRIDHYRNRKTGETWARIRLLVGARDAAEFWERVGARDAR